MNEKKATFPAAGWIFQHSSDSIQSTTLTIGHNNIHQCHHPHRESRAWRDRVYGPCARRMQLGDADHRREHCRDNTRHRCCSTSATLPIDPARTERLTNQTQPADRLQRPRQRQDETQRRPRNQKHNRTGRMLRHHVQHDAEREDMRGHDERQKQDGASAEEASTENGGARTERRKEDLACEIHPRQQVRHGKRAKATCRRRQDCGPADGRA